MIVALPGWGVPGPSPDPGQRHGRTSTSPGGSARGTKKIIIARNHRPHFFVLKSFYEPFTIERDRA